MAKHIEQVDETVTTLVTDLQETAKAYRADGLAATQIDEHVRVFVIRDSGTENFITCINPEIVQTTVDQLSSKEGCLSFPGVNEVVKRAEEIFVRYLDESGQLVECWFAGSNAVAFQHELDHLNGILFIHHMGQLQKRMALKKLEKVRRRTKSQMKNIQKMLAKSGASVRLQ